MKTLQLTEKEYNLIIEALNWSDLTMRDFDAKTDKIANQMVALKEKLELLELVPKEIIIEPGQPYYCNIRQGNTSSTTYYFDLVIKMANYEVNNGTYLFEISKNENFTEILDPKYLPQKFSGEISFMTSIFNTAYYFGTSQSQDFYFRITHKCTGYKDTISTKKIKAYRNQFEP
jgi:hypothetical protein